MNDKVSVTYKGIIVRLEGDTEWKFELRGVERSSSTLRLAKQEIDKPTPKTKIPFTRCKAFKEYRYGGDVFSEVEVTSAAIPEPYTSTRYFWVLSKSGREKVDNKLLYVDNDQNRATIKEITNWEKERDKLRTQIDHAMKSLTTMPFPKELEDTKGKP